MGLFSILLVSKRLQFASNRLCIETTGHRALNSTVNKGLKEYTLNSIPSPSILTM